jgi:hypothetical protein
MQDGQLIKNFTLVSNDHLYSEKKKGRYDNKGPNTAKKFETTMLTTAVHFGGHIITII